MKERLANPFHPKPLRLSFWTYPIYIIDGEKPKGFSAEEHIKTELEWQKFKVVRSNQVRKGNTGIHVAGEMEKVFNDIQGMPDFFCCRKIKGKAPEYFFVEVKSNADGIRVSQLDWYVRHPNLSVIIACPNTINITMSNFKDKLKEIGLL